MKPFYLFFHLPKVSDTHPKGLGVGSGCTISSMLSQFSTPCRDSSSESESAEDRGQGTPVPPVASPIGQSPITMETNEEESKTVEGLFGEGLDLSSS